MILQPWRSTQSKTRGVSARQSVFRFSIGVQPCPRRFVRSRYRPLASPFASRAVLHPYGNRRCGGKQAIPPAPPPPREKKRLAPCAHYKYAPSMMVSPGICDSLWVTVKRSLITRTTTEWNPPMKMPTPAHCNQPSASSTKQPRGHCGTKCSALRFDDVAALPELNHAKTGATREH